MTWMWQFKLSTFRLGYCKANITVPCKSLLSLIHPNTQQVRSFIQTKCHLTLLNMNLSLHYRGVPNPQAQIPPYYPPLQQAPFTAQAQYQLGASIFTKYLYKIILVSLCQFNNNKYYSNRRSTVLAQSNGTSLVQLGLGQQPKLALQLNRVRSGRK